MLAAFPFSYRMKYRNLPTEAQEQIALFTWAKMSEKTHPELALMFHCGNSIPMTSVAARRRGAMLRLRGIKAGVPDICLPVQRNCFGALFIEMKRTKGGRVSEEQEAFMQRLKDAGNRVKVCAGWIEAKQEIETYLAIR